MNAFVAACDRLDFWKILNQIAQYAPSRLGQEAIEVLLPSSDRTQIFTELSRVSELRCMIESEHGFPIDGIKDIRLALTRSGIENNCLSAHDLLEIGSTLHASASLKSFIEKRHDHYPELTSLCRRLLPNPVLEAKISQAIDENGNVKDSASKVLHDIRHSIINIHNILSKRLDKILRDVSEKGIAQDDIVTTREGRMVLPIKTERKNMVPGFIHSASASGSTVYIEPAETLPLNNEISELHFKEKREIARVLMALTNIVSESRFAIHENVKILTIIEYTYAKARYSIDIKGNRPFLIEKGSLLILQARHPLLLQKHGWEGVVPLDVEIGGAYATLLVTGPNAGGKTVALKTVGLLTLMVQSGIHIPASADSEFPLFDTMFVSIGDNQSIEDDLSTYSSQVLELKEIVDEANEHSLVLIDEIGAGTDPTEGGAIAAAVLRTLTNSGAITIATTHHGALKAFAYETPGIQNSAMEFNQTTLQPTYRFRVGIPGSSYALVIARRLGMSDVVLSDAQAMLGEQQSNLERLLLDLEFHRQEAVNEHDALAAECLENKKIRQDYETKLQVLKQEVKDIKAKALKQAREIIDRAHAAIENSVREIKLQNAEKNIVKQWRSEVNAIDEFIQKETASLAEPGTQGVEKLRDVTIGMLVQLGAKGQTGTVLTRPDTQGNLSVAFNSVKMKVNLNQLVAGSQSSAIEEQSSFFVKAASSTEIDLRGMYGDEGVAAVDKFLDDAVMSGLHRVEIIHGKGTGALRKRIHQFLKEDKRVAAFKVGEWNEGGTGVTVAEIH